MLSFRCPFLFLVFSLVSFSFEKLKISLSYISCGFLVDVRHGCVLPVA